MKCTSEEVIRKVGGCLSHLIAVGIYIKLASSSHYYSLKVLFNISHAYLLFFRELDEKIDVNLEFVH